MQKLGYILLLLLLANCTFAQKRLDCPEVFLGVHGGVKASSMLFSPSVKQLDILRSPLTGNGGLVFRYAEHRVCPLQVECNYMQQGWAEVYERAIYTRQLHYIELPFLMHLGFGKKKIRLFLNIGPQIGYCIADQVKVEGSEEEQFSKPQHQSIDNRFDWGAAAGFGCYYKTDRAGVFQVEARFDYSLGSAFKTGQLHYFKLANPIGLSINLGYLWEFKKK